MTQPCIAHPQGLGRLTYDHEVFAVSEGMYLHGAMWHLYIYGGAGEDRDAPRVIIEMQMGYYQVKGPEQIGSSPTLFHAVFRKS